MAYEPSLGVYLSDFGTAAVSGLQAGQGLRAGALQQQALQQQMQQRAELAPLQRQDIQQKLDQRGVLMGREQEQYEAQQGSLVEAKKNDFLSRGAFNVLNSPEGLQQQQWDAFIQEGVGSGFLPAEMEGEIGQPFDEEDRNTLNQFVRGGQKFSDLTLTAEQVGKQRVQERKAQMEERKYQALEEERDRKAYLDERKFQLTKAASEGTISSKDKKKEVEKLKKEADFAKGVSEANDSIRLVEELLASPGLSSAVGFGIGKSMPFYLDKDERGDPIFPSGTDAADFKARFDQIKGKAFLAAFQQLKGGGTITEAEGKKAESSLNRMQLSQSEEQFKAAAKDFTNNIQEGLRLKKLELQKQGIGTEQEALGGGKKQLEFNPGTGDFE